MWSGLPFSLQRNHCLAWKTISYLLCEQVKRNKCKGRCFSYLARVYQVPQMQVPSTSFSVDFLWTLTQTEYSAQKNKMDWLGVGRGLNKPRSLGALSKAKHMGLKKKENMVAGGSYIKQNGLLGLKKNHLYCHSSKAGIWHPGCHHLQVCGFCPWLEVGLFWLDLPFHRCHLTNIPCFWLGFLHLRIGATLLHPHGCRMIRITPRCGKSIKVMSHFWCYSIFCPVALWPPKSVSRSSEANLKGSWKSIHEYFSNYCLREISFEHYYGSQSGVMRWSSSVWNPVTDLTGTLPWLDFLCPLHSWQSIYQIYYLWLNSFRISVE